MNQIIFDYLCDQCDSGSVEGLVDGNVYYAAEYITKHFDNTEIYEQIDRLLQKYFAHKASEILYSE